MSTNSTLRMRNFPVIPYFLFALSTFSIGLSALSFSAVATRGQCPDCQEGCLAKHTEKMRDVARKYEKTGDRLEYQMGVDHVVNEYRLCLDNCREPYPVK